MASQLMREMQLTNLQSQIGGLEIDQIADFAFFLGDINYRLNTTFEDLNNSNILEAFEMVGTKKEQLAASMMDGNYPNYTEPKISFYPSYKMAFEDGMYIEKKN